MASIAKRWTFHPRPRLALWKFSNDANASLWNFLLSWNFCYHDSFSFFASSDASILQTSLAQSCCITALLLYFCIYSRAKNREDDQTINLFIFAFVSSLLSFLFGMNLNKCLVTILNNVVTCIFVVSVAFLHMNVSDSTKCGTIILFHTVCTNFALLYFYGMLLLDGNKFCTQCTKKTKES